MKLDAAARKRNRQDEKREKILSAARHLMAREGVEGLRPVRLAEELGWATPGLYYYFSGISAIRDALVEQLMTETVEASLVAAKKGKTGIEALQRVFEARIRYFRDNPADFDLFFSHFTAMGVSQEVLEKVVYPASWRLNDYLEARLKSDQKAGLVGRGVNLRRVINLMVLMAHGVVQGYLAFERIQGSMRYDLEEMVTEGKRMLKKALL